MKDLTTVESSDKVQDVRGAVTEIANLAKRQARINYEKFKLDETFINKCLDFFNELTGVTYTKLEYEHIYFWLIEEE